MSQDHQKKPQNILYHYYYYLDPHAFHAMENGNVLVAVVLVYNRRFDQKLLSKICDEFFRKSNSILMMLDLFNFADLLIGWL